MRPGVRRVLGGPVNVAAALTDRGWTVAVVPPARTDDELWDGLSAALDLPAWFGRNLDALDEVVGELDGPAALVLASWWVYARARPARFAALLAVLDGRVLVALAD